MPNTIRILLLEDSATDAELVLRELKRAKFEATARRVETEAQFRQALLSSFVDVILADYSLPSFSGAAALEIARELVPEVPFIFVSGSIGEERAIDALHNGATDYILKDRLSRLGPAVLRAIDERRNIERRRAAEDALRLNAQRFEFAARSTSDALWDWDLATNRIWTTEELTGHAAEGDRDFQWWIDRIHPDDRERVRTFLRATIDRGEERWTDEYRFRSDGGEWLCVVSRAYVLRDRSGTPLRVIGAVQDVTDERRAEQAIRESEIRFRSVAETAADGIVLADAQCLITYANEQAARMFRTTVSALIGRDTRTLIVEEVRDEYDRITNHLAANAPASLTLSTRARRDGSGFPLDVSISSWMLEGRLFFTKILRDVTERVATEQRLVEAQQMARVGSVECDIATDLVLASDEIYEMFELPRDESITFEQLVNRIADEGRERVSEAFRRHVAGRETGMLLIQCNTRRSDGSERVIECRCRTELDSAGVPRRLIGTFQDITDRVTATRTIEELSRRTQAILECAAEGIIGTTVAEGVVFVNPAAVALLGWPEETLLSMTDLHTLIHHTKADGTPYPHDECPLLRTIRDGRRRAVNGDVWWRQNGESFLVDFECAPLVHDDEIRGLVVTFRDVTESRRLTSQLEMANRIGSLGRVAATIAHEFNNVLMGIMPFAEVIRRRAQDNEDLLKAGDHIANSVRRGRRVTEEILRFTRPFDPVLEKIDLCEWLLQLEGELRALTSEAGVSVVVNTRDAPLRVKCDPAQLQQVVTNLTLNARDAIGQRGGEIVVTLQRHGRTAELTVRDSGPGIPPDRLEAVFEPLFTTKRSGTGLGLAVARQIVTLHGGTIEAANARGGGAVMTMTLPLADVREDIAGTLIAAPEAQA